MQRRATITHSRHRIGKMKASIGFVLCCAVGSALGYYVPREAPYNVGPNDPYSVEISSNFLQEPSQRLFWGTSGTNQVGGTGLWATLTNKFPILATMFGRMEMPSTQYGVPSTSYGVPNVPSFQYYQPPQQYYPAPFFGTNFQPARDVGFTDDAVIITPPQVPIAPQPQPAPEPTPGYQYRKPQYRLELPQK